MAADTNQTYIVVYGSASQVDRTALSANGNQILSDLGPAGVMIVGSSNPAGLEALPGVTDVADDSMMLQVPQDSVETAPSIDGGGGFSCATTTTACGLQWDLARIHVPDAWKTTMGSPSVKVAVLDTGLNSRHEGRWSDRRRTRRELSAITEEPPAHGGSSAGCRSC